jgi:hypothetical protein
VLAEALEGLVDRLHPFPLAEVGSVALLLNLGPMLCFKKIFRRKIW